MFLVSLKGRSLLWDHTDLSTSFLTLKRFTSTWNQRYSSSTSRNSASIFAGAVVLLDFQLFIEKPVFECAFGHGHSMIPFLSYFVKNNVDRVSVICKLVTKWYLVRKCAS